MAKTATVDVVMNLSALRSQFTEVSRALQRSLEAATANVDLGLDLDGQLNSELDQVQFRLRGIAVEAERVARSMSTITADGIDLDADASGVLDAIRLAQTSLDSLAFEEQVELVADASAVWGSGQRIWGTGFAKLVSIGANVTASRRRRRLSWRSCVVRTRSCGWNEIYSNERRPSG